jgi:hypothetical protein
MATRFPNVVVWDGTKRHHVAVIVDRLNSIVCYQCAECDVDVEWPIGHLDHLRDFLKGHPSCQIVVWAEIHD